MLGLDVPTVLAFSSVSMFSAGQFFMRGLEARRKQLVCSVIVGVRWSCFTCDVVGCGCGRLKLVTRILLLGSVL